MKNHFYYFMAFASSVFLLSSCASLTGFEEGRSLGEGNSELGVSGNFTRAPDLFADEDEIIDSLEISSSISFPNIEVSYKRGVTDQLDVGARISSNFNASAFLKYQVVGDKTSNFALSPGFEFGTVLGLAYNVGIPIYASYYPSDAVAINLTPRYMYQFISGAESSGVSYLGGNFGLLFGRKNKFGLDIGYYNVGQEGGSDALISFGVGGKFRFGDFDFGSSDKSSRKKRKR